MLGVKLDESYLEGWDEYKELEKKLEKYRKSKFGNRPLPNKWRVGQKVRFLSDSEWAWSKGSVWYVVELRPEYANCFASEYQVFYTSPDMTKKKGIFWTTPNDVELVEDVPDDPTS
jgi:hypothetical protein